MSIILPIEIAGYWKGTYFYDSPELAVVGEGVDFELRLTQSMWQRFWGRFEGSVFDDPIRGIPDEGRIEGRVRETLLEFTKLLPEFYVGHAGRPVPLHEHLGEQGYDLWYGLAHPPIRYTGNFRDAYHAEGTWVIAPFRLKLEIGLELDLPRCSGTFTLTKAE
jgi:hypothetical protein